MKYPIVQARENGRAGTNAFLGINRLPEGREGEGAEFKNLSLDLYPAASTCGLGDTGELIYIKDEGGADAVIDFSKLQAVAEVYEESERLYLTGVYDGDFYYKGVKIYYYEECFLKIAPTDRITIERLGSEYVILAVKEDNKSSIWSYRTVGTDGASKNKVSDGYLNTEMLKYKFPKKFFNKAYIYKENINDINDETQTYRIFLYSNYYFTANRKISTDDYNNYVSDLYDLSDVFSGLVGAGLVLTSKETDFGKKYYDVNAYGNAGNNLTEGDFYLFDDYREEYPVRFVVDRVDNNTGRRNYEGALAYGVTKSTNPVYNRYRAYYCYDVPNNGNINGETSHNPVYAKYGIWGHFEKWNEDKLRYDPYNMTDGTPIWRRVQMDLSGEKPIELLACIEDARDADRNTFVPTMAPNASYAPLAPVAGSNFTTPATLSIIELDKIFVRTDSWKLSHVTAYKNRIFGVVNDGTMLVCSEFGSYTDFGEFSGISTDSGYFNSLTSGKFTGISEYQGTLVVFKANRMSIYYGDTPSDMVLSHEIKNVGCIDSESIKEVNGQLIFLGPDGFYAYSGGQPQHISRKLAKKYTSARAFTVGRKYYASTDSELLIYDTDTGAWTCSERIELKAICGERLFLADGSVKKVLDNEEWSGDWKYESMDIFEDIMDDKGINEIYIRAKLKGSMVVSTITDEEEKVHQTIEDDGERMKVWRVPVKFKHGNFYRIRIEGSGSCILYAVERKCYAGGRVR